jgi:hypothetical protein
MIALAGTVLHAEDNDLLSCFINSVVDQVQVLPSHELTNTFGCLQKSHIRKQDEVCQAVIDRSTDGFRGLRIASADIVGKLG